MWMRAAWMCVLFMVAVACGAEHREPALPDATADANASDATSTTDANGNGSAHDGAANDGHAASDATTPTDASDDVVSCDHRQVTCRAAEPVCPEMQVASVSGSCWGPCVPIDRCVCSGPEDCPHAETFACHLHRQRCGPYVN